MPHGLLICGSRSLATCLAAEVWAKGILRRELMKADAALSGAAEGPDRWMRQEALALAAAGGRAVPFVEYTVEGVRTFWEPHPLDALRAEGGYRPRRSRWCPERNHDPLVRNQAMIEAMAKKRLQGWSVRVVGLVDGRLEGNRKSGGTNYTLRLAWDHGIDLERLVWLG